MLTRELQHSWSKGNEVIVEDGEELSSGGTLDLPFLFLYSALGAISFIVMWQFYLKKCRDTGLDDEIPEPQATSQGEEAVKKSVGERMKELLAGFEKYKVQMVSKL
jgi:hypothetical protein